MVGSFIKHAWISLYSVFTIWFSKNMLDVSEYFFQYSKKISLADACCASLSTWYACIMILFFWNMKHVC